MMGTTGGLLPFLCLGYIISFTCILEKASLVQGSTFCSASIDDTHLKCTNTSVIFVHKLLSHEINDHHPSCLRQLKVMCNMQRKCTLPTVCKRLPPDTYIAYGCVPEPQKKIQCSDTQIPMLLTKRAFLVSYSYPRKVNPWGQCLWRIKAATNGTINIYILDLVGRPDLVIHTYPLLEAAGRRILNTTALSINITSDHTLDLSLVPISKAWIAIELTELTNKNVTLRDHFFCRPPMSFNDQFRALCGSCASNLAGMRIALIVMSCIILILIASLCIIVHCYCKKFKSFDSTPMRPVEPYRQRQTSAVTPYHTTIVHQPLMSTHVNGVSDIDNLKKPYKEHTYDHLNNFRTVNYNLKTPQTVKIDPQKEKPFRKRSFDDEDSDSTYATVGENA